MWYGHSHPHLCTFPPTNPYLLLFFPFAEEFSAHGANVNCLSLGSKSGRVLVTGGDDKKVNLWAIGKPSCIMVNTTCFHCPHTIKVCFKSHAHSYVSQQLVTQLRLSFEKSQKEGSLMAGSFWFSVCISNYNLALGRRWGKQRLRGKGVLKGGGRSPEGVTPGRSFTGLHRKLGRPCFSLRWEKRRQLNNDSSSSLL